MKKYKQIFAYLGEYKNKVYLVILLSTISIIGNVYLPYIMSGIIDNGVKNHDLSYLLRMGLLMIAVTANTCLFGVLSSRIAGITSSGLGNNLRKAMMEKLCDFSSKDIDDFTKASFINRMTGDVNGVQEAVGILLGNFINAPITIVCIIIMSFNIDKSLALIFLVAVPLFSVASYLIIKKARPYFSKNATKFDVLNRVLLEDLINIRLIKAFVREDYITTEYKKAADDVRSNGLKAEQITNNSTPVQQLIVNFCIILLLWFGGQRIMAGSLDVGELFSFITYTNQILYQITLISVIIVPLINILVSVDRVLEVLNKEPSVIDTDSDDTVIIKDGSISFEHLYFDYAKDTDKENMLLQDINLNIKDKETIGIVGATGAGKSTLVNLIPRLFDYSEGRIIVGGLEVTKYSFDKLRGDIAFTLQKSTLFSGSLRENLLCGNKNATEEDMIKACEEACIYDYVASCEEGFDIHIEEGGSNVSGGQRQRLCLARAFIKNSKILIMDDCTSALDKATERAVIDHIINDYSDRTRILISGKISSIRRMDRIIVMDRGRISGIGTHDELYKNNAIYKDLCVSQGEV